MEIPTAPIKMRIYAGFEKKKKTLTRALLQIRHVSL